MPTTNLSKGITYFSVLFAFLVFFGCTLAPSEVEARPQASKPSVIPSGTILPVVLRTTISPETAKQGQTVRGQIAQDVPLPDGTKIHKGSKVEGQIVEVAAAAGASGAKISIRFDKIYSRGQMILITTNLRAIAGFMEVLRAAEPTQGMGETEVANWLTTTQIGGDSVFGVGGPVASAHDTGKIVGKSMMDGGVLVEPSANGRCRGAVDGNNHPQPLWVFSSDACGTYGLSDVQITHAGRTAPVGTFTLDLQNRKTKIQSGAGLLLRVIS
jgi:hypothetical protein